MVLNLGCKSAVVLVSLLCAISFGQFPSPGTQLQNFNVQGTVRIEQVDVMSGAKVTFGGENISKTVYTDERGHYETNRSPGYYTMVVFPSINGLQTYWRPLFHVASSARLTLDASLDLDIPCDRVATVSHTITNHVADDACGGWVYFEPPSTDGAPYQLLIVYPHRQPTNRGNIYSCLSILGQKTQVRVAYDLFILRADLVSYDEKSGTLEAKGDVVRTNEKGETQTAESMTFRIENGEATRLP